MTTAAARNAARGTQCIAHGRGPLDNDRFRVPRRPICKRRKANSTIAHTSGRHTPRNTIKTTALPSPTRRRVRHAKCEPYATTPSSTRSCQPCVSAPFTQLPSATQRRTAAARENAGSAYSHSAARERSRTTNSTIPTGVNKSLAPATKQTQSYGR